MSACRCSAARFNFRAIGPLSLPTRVPHGARVALILIVSTECTRGMLDCRDPGQCGRQVGARKNRKYSHNCSGKGPIIVSLPALACA
jgi:hypothetical protein